MSDSGENKYKWTPESTTLLVSVWTDKQVQKQLEYATRPQLIWDSVAKYMNKKGYSVTGKQCRSRMKQVLVCYREAKRAGTKAGVEQYYESIDRVLKHKRLEHLNHNGGVDTVDSATIKSPPKDVKTNKNIQMRYKFQQPPESIYRTEALSPIWSGGRDEGDYPDSPESNETVLAQPFRVFSPVRDAATNTTQHQLGATNKRMSQQSGTSDEAPIKETFRQSAFNNYFSEIPYQNTVQNVQNQIIQENMQQNQAILHQNVLQSQLLEHNRLQMNPVLRQNIQNLNQGLFPDQGVFNQPQLGLGQNIIAENVLQMQNKGLFNAMNNRAAPQEPRKANVRQNLAATYRQFQDAGMQNCNLNLNHIGFMSPSISPDIPQNLNEAFCQQRNEAPVSTNQLNMVNADLTTITNNATFNDDTISIEFLQESPTPDSEPTKLKDFATNTEIVPSVPLRKKKVEKLENLMMSAINSQNEVVNKILAAQNEMVTRVLDLDRDRQNRLENRLDHLLDVVQTAVLNKSADKSGEIPPSPPDPMITNLVPPPKPGIIPPKLDLVPPKPCRVPCTGSNGNSQPVNQPPVNTRPGVVSPISSISPTKRVGSIWQKLGPVSTSPFVRAQQQLGFMPIHTAENDIRTKSSAERRISKEFQNGMDTKTLIFETNNFLEAERRVQEDVENARIKEAFDSRQEPSAAMILTAAFIDAEIQSTEIIENARLNWLRQRQRETDKQLLNNPMHQYRNNDYMLKNNAGNRNDDILLAGQGDSYERLKQLHARERAIGNPCDSSTPSKIQQQKREQVEVNEPRQTIQQLAQLVMNSARWRNPTATLQRKDLNTLPGLGNTQKNARSREDVVTLRNTPEESGNDNQPQYFQKHHPQQVDGRAKTLDWLRDRYSYGGQPTDSKVREIPSRLSYNEPPQKPSRSMGFTADFLMKQDDNNNRRSNEEKHVGFVSDDDFINDAGGRVAQGKSDPFEELQQLYIQKQLRMSQSQGLPFMMQNGKIIFPQHDMIERYVQDMYSKDKRHKDDDSDNDEEFLDTTTSMPSSRKNSLTSSGTKSGKESGCVIS
ncbi:hypothetical protein QAD02_017626 [Eretmocerus hayati]|uniref:Uncharacterized protein n=1 Tax=Eretmocerus hayati TaxID=131215 RepID=A0ACC2PE41_9HYME|nr:hypothetical protein QAD02_017626 [Eretmocerus hayati]